MQTHKKNPVSRFIDEGNPNTQHTIQDVREAAHLPLNKVDTFYSDQQMAHEIRKAIEREESVPDAVKNINVQVEKGIVTLTGSVSTEQEKMTIGDKAAAFAGFSRVINQIGIVSHIV